MALTQHQIRHQIRREAAGPEASVRLTPALEQGLRESDLLDASCGTINTAAQRRAADGGAVRMLLGGPECGWGRRGEGCGGAAVDRVTALHHRARGLWVKV